MNIRQCVCSLLIAVTLDFPLEAFAQNPAANLGITILEGKNGIIDETQSVEIVVRVTKPGAKVIFTIMPGAGVALPGNVTRVSVTSDANGIAKSGAMSSTGKGADFEVEVEASLNGETAMTVVHESNRTGNPDKSAKTAKHKSKTWLWIAILGGGGGAAAAFASMNKGNSDSSSSGSSGSSPSVPVTFGTPTVGAP